jgi:hypothetical protein
MEYYQSNYSSRYSGTGTSTIQAQSIVNPARELRDETFRR